jgi:hypothetical protein
MWESRKEDQLGRDLIQQKKEREILLKRTQKLYENMQQYDEQDKRYFKEPLEHWEQATNKNIKDWLVMAEKLTEKSNERATKRVTQNQPRITSHFTRVMIKSARDCPAGHLLHVRYKSSAYNTY